MIVNIYLVVTTAIFAYTLLNQFETANNYFAAMLSYSSNPLNIFILYNMIVTLSIAIYKTFVLIFFEAANEGETMKIIDKFKSKVFDVILFCYIIELQFNFQVYLAIVVLFTLYTIHIHLTFRTEFLIHVQTTNNSLRLHYRTLALYIVLLFVDFQILKYNGMNIFAIQNEREAMFLYYMILIAFSLAEPFINFAIQFYEKYTFGHFRNSDQFLLNASLVINIPRNVILILLSLCITLKFQQPFFIILSCFDNLGQLKDCIQSYYKCRNLTKSMKFLKTVEKEDLNNYHDLTCTVCYEQISQGKLLPCSHIFHEECIRQWIIKNNNHFCPKCKREFNFDNLHNQYNHETSKKPKTQEEIFNQFRTYLKQTKNEEAFGNKEQGNEGLMKKDFDLLNQKWKDLKDQNGYKQESKMGEGYDEELQRESAGLLVDKMIEKQQKYDIKQDRAQYRQYRVGKEGKARHYIVNQPQMADLPLEYYERQKKKIVALGSLPFSMPTMAVSNRTGEHMKKRREYKRQIQVILQLMNMNKHEQLLFV